MTQLMAPFLDPRVIAWKVSLVLAASFGRESSGTPSSKSTRAVMAERQSTSSVALPANPAVTGSVMNPVTGTSTA